MFPELTWLAPVREQAPSGATSSWDAYLADRKSKGFTAVLIAPAIAYWNSTLPQPAGFSFKKKSSGCSSPVPNTDYWQQRKQYWQFFKNMVGKATKLELVTVVVGVMNPAGINVNDTYPNTASAKKFAGFLKGLLGGSNVVFSPAFDDDPEAKNGSRGDLMNEVGLALRGTNQTGHLVMLTNHLSGGKSNCDEYRAFANPADASKRWMTLYLFQSGHGGGTNPDLTGPCAPVSTNTDVDNALLRARVMSSTLSGYTPAMPAVNGEGPYDATNYTGTVNHPDVDTRYRVRQAGPPADEPCIVGGGKFWCDTGRTGGDPEVRHAFGGAGSGFGFLGDVDGDGREDPCVYTSGGVFRCDTDHEGGAAEVQIAFSMPGGPVPLLGDVDGDGRADPCLAVAGRFSCDTRHDGGSAETVIRFGKRGDQILLGDFDGDGRDDPCVFRKGMLLCDTAHDGGAAEGSLNFGKAGDRLVLGNLDGL